MTEERQAGERQEDSALLRRAELALTQLNNQYGLSPDQGATLTAIRLRLEGRERASLDDLLDAGKDLADSDPLREALRKQGQATGPSFEDVLDSTTKRPKRSLDDLL